MSEQSVHNVLRTQRYGIYFRMLDKMLIDQIIPDCPVCGYHLTIEYNDEIGIREPLPKVSVAVKCTNIHACGLELQVEVLMTDDGPAYQELRVRRLNRTGGILPPGKWPEPPVQIETHADGRANRQINM